MWAHGERRPVTLFSRVVGWSLPLMPPPLVRWAAAPYVAGDEPADALARTASLNERGLAATLALLGEEIDSRELAIEGTGLYVDLVDQIADRELDCNVSVKLTLLGLKIERELCRDHLAGLVERAAERGNFVRIDMEDHTCTTATLDMYREVLAESRARGAGGGPSGSAASGDAVGVVLQAYLHRTLADIAGLPKGANVRLCKGIYVEPPSVAITDYHKVRRNFLASLEALFDRGVYVGIATHDDYLLRESAAIIERRGLAGDRYEFQMLLGVTENRRDALAAAGHRMRIYVPYGRQWYAYSTRRLRENPRIAGHVARAFFLRMVGGRHW
jgi:proline dehydrogenase